VRRQKDYYTDLTRVCGTRWCYEISRVLAVPACTNNEYESDNFVGLSRTDDNQLYLQSILRYFGDAYRSTTGQDEAGWKREWELVDDSDWRTPVGSTTDMIAESLWSLILLSWHRKYHWQSKPTLKPPSLNKTRENVLHFSCGLPVKSSPPSSTSTTKTKDAGDCSSIDPGYG